MIVKRKTKELDLFYDKPTHNMKHNLRLFLEQVQKIKAEFADKTPLSKVNKQVVMKKIELEQIYVQLRDGNYNRKLLERALILGKEFEYDDRIVALRKRLYDLNAQEIKENGCRARREILDQLAAIIVEDNNPFGESAKEPRKYLRAAEQLDNIMREKKIQIGESEYEDELKEAWVLLREEYLSYTKYYNKAKTNKDNLKLHKDFGAR